MVQATATSSAIHTVDGTISVNVEGERVSVKLPNTSRQQLARYARLMKARYDVASTTDENRRHWANADNLSANAANSPGVRRVLCMRSRYECSNNSYARGVIDTQAIHTVGTGPRPQFVDSRISKASAKWLQAELGDWLVEIGMGEKLRTMRKDKGQSGEGLAVTTANFNIDHPVKLDFRTIECDRLSDPQFVGPMDERNVDGVILDVYGNPAKYKILKRHPGDFFLPSYGPDAHDTLDARYVSHWFTASRSGQYRGIPEITPALPLFACLRRFTLAVIAAAESAATAAGVIYSDLAPEDSGDDPEPMDTLEIERNTWLTMPRGWKMGQIDAKQPVTTYADFKREVLKEIGRCIQMPYNLIAGDSSDYNFASGKLDSTIYCDSTWVDRDLCEKAVLRNPVREWFAEARLIPGYLPADVLSLIGRGDTIRVPRNQWHWDALDFSDSVKRATARNISINGGFGNPVRYFQEDGLDPEAEAESIAEFYGVGVDELKAKWFDNLGKHPPAPLAQDDDSDQKQQPRRRQGGERATAN